VEATEEAVLNSLLQAETVSGRDGHTSGRLPVDELRKVLAQPAGGAPLAGARLAGGR